MSLSNTQKDQLAAAGIAMFGVPMGGYSGMLESMLENSAGNMQSVINQLAELPYFKSLFPGDNTAVATKLAKAYGFDSVTGGLGQQVKDFFSTQLNNGASVPQLIKIANDFLFSTTAPEYADTKALFLNKIAVANFYTYGLQIGSQDLNELQQAIASVNSSSDSVLSAKITLVETHTPPPISGTPPSDGNDVIIGTDGNNNFSGGIGNDSLDGGAGNDTLFGNSGNDILKGGKGRDILIGGEGADQIEAGTYADYQSSYINGKYLNTHIYDAFAEVLQGNDGADMLWGGYGSDYIDGGSGADQIAGDNSAYDWGAATADQLRYMMNDIIKGGDGEDRINGNYGTDWIDGGAGNDIINLPTGGGVAKGGAGDDRIEGSNNNDTILGEDGNDAISCYQNETGTDSIDAGTGNDTINWVGNNVAHLSVNAGSGDDNISIYGFSGTASVIAGEGVDKVSIGNGRYTIDLSETSKSKDTIVLNIAVGGNDPMAISKVQGFDAATDIIDVSNFHLIKNATTLGSRASSGHFSTSDGTLHDNYVQKLDSPTTTLMGPQGSKAYELINKKYVYNVDFAGKGIFLVTGASAAAADTATVAAFLNPYGNNATYLSKETHYFMVNIQGQGAALYFFQDDTGANNNIVADELTPQVMLTGISTESLSYLNFG